MYDYHFPCFKFGSGSEGGSSERTKISDNVLKSDVTIEVNNNVVEAD